MSATPREMEGYTLIEMIVVLGVLALILSTTLSLNFRGSESRKLQEQAREISMMLKAARTEAVIKNAETGVEADLSTNVISIHGKSERLIIDKRLRLKLLTARQEVMGDKGSIRFFPNGTSTGGVVMLQSGERSAAVHVDWLTAKISLSR
jgi:general secretion pathway protein H